MPTGHVVATAAPRKAPHTHADSASRVSGDDYADPAAGRGGKDSGDRLPAGGSRGRSGHSYDARHVHRRDLGAAMKPTAAQKIALVSMAVSALLAGIARAAPPPPATD